MSRATFIQSICGGGVNRFNTILQAVSIEHDISQADILSHSKTADIIPARWEFWTRLYNIGWSYPRIGKHVRRHHTSVMHGVKEHLKRSNRNE